jgi:type I restriction enzyme, R subunit
MLNEQQLEDQCSAGFQQAGWRYAHDPHIAPEGAHAERADFRQVVLRDRFLAPSALMTGFQDRGDAMAAMNVSMAEVETLAALRDTLLPKLLSGALSVGAYHPNHVEVSP